MLHNESVLTTCSGVSWPSWILSREVKGQRCRSVQTIGNRATTVTEDEGVRGEERKHNKSFMWRRRRRQSEGRKKESIQRTPPPPPPPLYKPELVIRSSSPARRDGSEQQSEKYSPNIRTLKRSFAIYEQRKGILLQVGL